MVKLFVGNLIESDNVGKFTLQYDRVLEIRKEARMMHVHCAMYVPTYLLIIR